MKKKFFVVCLLFLSIMMFGIPSQHIKFYAESEMVTSKSACLMDHDSKTILYEKDSHKHLPVASMVKMMTILLTLENIESGKISLDDMVLTSENASSMGGSQVFLDPYVEYKLSDLLKGVIMASANDGSVALSEYISGSEQNFVKQMNKRAKELQMNDTNYVNSTGLPAPEQYSCAYDCAILLGEVVKHDIYHKYSTIWMDNLVHPSGRVTGLVNTNRLVKYYQGCDGGKTGSTDEAGCCLSASAKRDNMRLISVIVGADNSKTRFGECSSLFNFGFQNFENKCLVDEKEAVKDLQVSKGKITNVKVYPKESFHAVVNKGKEENYDVSIDIPSVIKAGKKALDEVGKIIIKKDNSVIKEIPIVVNEDLQKMGYLDSIKKICEKW